MTQGAGIGDMLEACQDFADGQAGAWALIAEGTVPTPEQAARMAETARAARDQVQAFRDLLRERPWVVRRMGSA